MADFDFDGYGGGLRIGAGQVQRMVRLIALACSVGLVVGGGVWGYRLAVRDVSGVPVIHAPKVPMRLAPDNPGGSVADHQGMAINAIAAVGETGTLPDEIVLAPGPAQLSPEDTAGLAPLPAAVAAVTLAPTAPGPMPLEAAALAPVEVAQDPAMAGMPAIDPAALQIPMPLDDTDDAVAMALAEALSLDVEPLDGPTVAPESAEAEAEAADVADDGIARSIRPHARPESLRANGDMPAEAATMEPTTPEIDPATLARGTRLVQLGAFDSADLARGEWAKVLSRFGDLMTGKSLVIEAAESGGRTFYRLRAHGFAGEDDVRRFCAALVAEDAACIPATVR